MTDGCVQAGLIWRRARLAAADGVLQRVFEAHLRCLVPGSIDVGDVVSDRTLARGEARHGRAKIAVGAAEVDV